MIPLGKKGKVDLREVWPNEAADFTPWLAENLSLLGETLGLDLELQTREAPVGEFSLDILARDIGTGRPIIIENQLEDTDHGHLGQILTYASGYDASVIVWIAKSFRDEHREALDWLNHRTGEDTEFFGLEIELWKIDDSKPAPNFKPVVTSNQWSKQTTRKARTTGGESEKGKMYWTFFQDLIAILREKHGFPPTNPSYRSWHLFLAGHASRVRWGVAFGRNDKVRVEVYIDHIDKDWNKQLFDHLAERKEGIESSLQESLEWSRMDESKASRIAAVRSGSIYDDQETLDEIQSWMVEHLLKFKAVFGPVLDELDV